jgi:transposase-like protein
MSKEVQVISGKMKMISGEETKKKLVLESYDSGLSLNQFAKQRGISPASLCQWRKKYPMGDFGTQDAEDIGSLKAENEALKRELFKIKAYLGHKIYEFEGIQLA